MRKLMLCSACLALGFAPAGALAKNPQLAAAGSSTRATCDAKYYDYLVGRTLTRRATSAARPTIASSLPASRLARSSPSA